MQEENAAEGGSVADAVAAQDDVVIASQHAQGCEGTALCRQGACCRQVKHTLVMTVGLYEYDVTALGDGLVGAGIVGACMVGVYGQRKRVGLQSTVGCSDDDGRVRVGHGMS